ncbi:hypothetical protein Cob_v004367 [Colletotrichum orbiculare MAFF 240422]|uniref:Berberine/berberine-like domain-containing protein n=1 Tax=Colletotrichum orbiculare (strain 104-T / ATCC 96160 / CBS 514.97 / LARS 414 / MAFF 240422) TaxID=1213857 RepID=A0A484FZ37_COLOR|nr:hypothetical protein Cob_v004367 [Colletotrichum orbiculare MAFF 240422]
MAAWNQYTPAIRAEIDGNLLRSPSTTAARRSPRQGSSKNLLEVGPLVNFTSEMDSKQRNHTGESGGGVGQHSNYISGDVQFKGGFGENSERLVELKPKYDPDNRFSRSAWKIVAFEQAVGKLMDEVFTKRMTQPLNTL